MIFQNHVLFDKNDCYSLRGVCMILIMCHHLYPNLMDLYPFHFPLDAILVDIGYLASGTFLFLSGYGLHKSLDKNEITKKYVISHIKKLILPFLFIFLIDMFRNIISGTFNITFTALNLVTLTFTNAGTLWFFKIIFCLYIILFILHKYISSAIARTIILWTITCSFVVIAINTDLQPCWWNSLLCFPLGYTISQYFIANKTVSVRYAILMGGVFVTCWIIMYLFHISPMTGLLFYFFKILIAMLFSIAAISIISKINITTKAGNFVGKNSLCFYLFHVFTLGLGFHIVWWQLVLLIFGITVALTFTYNTVEHLKDKLFDGN